MEKNFNYLVEKNNETKDIVYIEYKTIDGYKITPKTKKEDAIEINKIVFVSPSLTEKLIKKKIDVKLKFLLNDLKKIDEEDDDEGENSIRESLVTAERLKLNILNNYIKYLGNEYRDLSLKKLQIIIEELRIRLYTIKERKYEQIYYPAEIEEKRGRGR